MKTVILTGPNGNLGIEILKRLLTSYHVIGISRSASQIDISSINQKKKIQGIYLPINIDLAENEISEIISQISERLKHLNSEPFGLINNAFTSFPNSSLSLDKIAVMENAESFLAIHIRLSLEFANLINEKNNASIVNISSIYGKVAPRPNLYEKIADMNPILYGSYKAGLIQATKYLSALLAPKGIRVNTVSYGPFPKNEIRNSNPEFIKKLASNTHLNRVGNPEEASGIIEFLISNSASYITGADIPVDGGWTAW
tara:strand:+ start:1316 stop:2086 length:771 start_codon:yes stop_codon:yes gene_type:complete